MGWGAAIGGAVTGLGGIFGGKEQADAMNHAADLESQANQASLRFSRESAENQWQNSEADRQANYGMYAARQRSMNTIRSAMGLPTIDIAAYTPGVNPNYTASYGPSTISGAADAYRNLYGLGGANG